MDASQTTDTLPDAELPVADPQPPEVAASADRRTFAFTLDRLPGRDPKPESYVGRHIDVRLDHAQGLKLRQLFEGLLQAEAELQSGKRITSPADAVRYLLEQLQPVENHGQETREESQQALCIPGIGVDTGPRVVIDDVEVGEVVGPAVGDAGEDPAGPAVAGSADQHLDPRSAKRPGSRSRR